MTQKSLDCGLWHTMGGEALMVVGESGQKDDLDRGDRCFYASGGKSLLHNNTKSEPDNKHE